MLAQLSKKDLLAQALEISESFDTGVSRTELRKMSKEELIDFIGEQTAADKKDDPESLWHEAAVEEETVDLLDLLGIVDSGDGSQREDSFDGGDGIGNTATDDDLAKWDSSVDIVGMLEKERLEILKGIVFEINELDEFLVGEDRDWVGQLENTLQDDGYEALDDRDRELLERILLDLRRKAEVKPEAEGLGKIADDGLAHLEIEISDEEVEAEYARTWTVRVKPGLYTFTDRMGREWKIEQLGGAGNWKASTIWGEGVDRKKVTIVDVKRVLCVKAMIRDFLAFEKVQQ